MTGLLVVDDGYLIVNHDVSVFSQQVLLFNDTIEKNSLMNNQRSDYLKELCDEFSINDIHRFIYTSNNNLSGGEIQTIGLIRLFVQLQSSNSSLIILDETINNLDTQSKDVFLESSRKNSMIKLLYLFHMMNNLWKTLST